MGTVYRKLKKTAEPMFLYRAPRIAKPVFILSAPRSGSTHLYEILRRHRCVISLDNENDSFWWSQFPYARHEVPSDHIAGTEVDSEVAEEIRRNLARHVHRALYNQSVRDFVRSRMVCEDPVYLEKTVANCFHLEAIERVFPDAKFIHLVRDGRATVSSMIEGWRSEQFMRRPLPFPNGSTVDYWTFPVPPGWTEVVHESLNKICAWSWTQHNRHVLDYFEKKPSRSKKLLRVRYEDLVTDPEETVRDVATFCGLEKTSRVPSYIRENRSSRTTVSKPRALKWKSLNPEEILEVEKDIAPMMATLGYGNG